jgi:hypothetical protein
MATATGRPRLHVRSDNVFFSGMAAIALIAVVIGFARTYLSTIFMVVCRKSAIRSAMATFARWDSGSG